MNGGGLRPIHSADGRLGIRVEKPSSTLSDQLDLPADKGMVVADVRPDSPAAKAGLKPHDILLEVAGKPVTSDAASFVRQVRDIKADEAFDVVVLRKGKKETLKGIKLPEARANAGAFGFAGPDGLPDARQFQPVPMPGPGGFGTPLNRLQVLPGNLNQNIETMSVQVNNDNFTIQANKNRVSYSIKGTRDGGVKVTDIVIKDGNTDVKANSVEKVPEKYREQVKKLLEGVK
jgi:membrane-associated protease RseP (regulator of RpoE activity)